MKHFLIITNTYKDVGLKLTNELSAYIEKNGGTSCQFCSTGETLEGAAPLVQDIPPETDCVLVLGGDGTLIRAAVKLVDRNIPCLDWWIASCH